jgi:hypothetical protein
VKAITAVLRTLFMTALAAQAIMLARPAHGYSSSSAGRIMPNDDGAELNCKSVPKTMDLALANRVPLDFSGLSVKLVRVLWQDAEPGDPEWAPFHDDETVDLQTGSTEGQVINVVPTRLGAQRLTIMAFLTNGSVATCRVLVSVKAGAKDPSTFFLSRGSAGGGPRPAWLVVLDLSKQFSKTELQPVAIFADPEKTIKLKAREVQFQILTVPGERSPIQLDPCTGMVEATSLGRVVIEGSFGGHSSFTCVIVRESVMAGRPQNCTDFAPQTTIPPAVRPKPIKEQ